MNHHRRTPDKAYLQGHGRHSRDGLTRQTYLEAQAKPQIDCGKPCTSCGQTGAHLWWWGECEYCVSPAIAERIQTEKDLARYRRKKQ